MKREEKSIVGLLLILSVLAALSACVSTSSGQHSAEVVNATPAGAVPQANAVGAHAPAPASAPNASSSPTAKLPRSTVASKSAAQRGEQAAPASMSGSGSGSGSVQPERSKPIWTPVSWNDLPGWSSESMPEVWNSLMHSCERPTALFLKLCAQLRPLSIADENEQKLFLMTNLQPFKILNAAGEANGLLTGYFEPVFNASRIKRNGFETPVYAATAEILNLRNNHSKWYSRQEIDNFAPAQEALKGQEIAWMSDPLDVLILQIQGSGRLNVTEVDGSQKWIKVVYAASNEQPYQSIGRYLLDHAEITDASWPGIKAWAVKNPDRVKSLLWVNPRYVFFKEEPLDDTTLGPKGAQGLELIAGRSVAVDPQYIPYGSPLWLVSDGPTLQLRRWVMAQDTGSAINGPVRADYFVGTGAQAGEIAGHLRQPLALWALMPRQTQ